ncbi:hypothetical protein QBC37DRAFT_41135 [Rhypophila decipiens]|uniref:F-box domain-containing protein n=1 Tax=Rhypophila decipiens TaxID=261697 RepID=A0AAN7BBJ8_9PEZI|nr:hypothetical protein QBC37DRAFT_41135 [Rhypophila decipiens]
MATQAVDEEGRRPSMEKKPIVVGDYSGSASKRPAFQRLPDEIIQQILQAADSNGFASLSLINSKWRSVAQQAHLYAFHLSNSPSYAMSHNASPPSTTADDLPKLRRLFAKEVKRNLFDAYLRPSKTVIKFISNSISSSSCPGGEGVQFTSSPKGHHMLGYNSSRIYVMDMREADLVVKREFKILRRPAATCINDAGTMLAVLLTEMQVDIYDLTPSPPKRTQSIILDHSPRAIALSPCGSVLAAAYEGGIEVSSLNPAAVSTERRAVKCDAVDALAFSFDGTQILGTTLHTTQPTTVILTAPYYDPGSHMADDNMSALWTTSILFPNTSRDCSHAVLIQNGKYEEALWAFTYDRSFETFRAVRIDDLRNGTTYFTGPVPSPTSQGKLIPCTLPAASYYGELVSAGFQGKDIWLYGVPEDLDAVPVPDPPNASSESGSNANGVLRRNSGPSARSASRMQENGDAARVPQWQVLCDKLRNTFVSGCRIGELEGVNTVKWVADFQSSSIKERLIVAARGVSPNMPITEDDGMDFVDGGRLVLVDFNYGTSNGTTQELVVEVGTKEPEVLEEEHRDMATEVAIVRRRTVAQKRGTRGPINRSATSANRAPPVPALPPPPAVPSSSSQLQEEDDDPLVPRRVGAAPVRRIDPPAAPEDSDIQEPSIEEQEALDAPYSHASPRSGTTLRRAATAAAVNRRLHPPQAAAGNVEYRRADGRTEHPHESDADNWVPPPPPYQKEDPGDMPDFLRHAIPPVTAVDSSGPHQQGQSRTGPQQIAQPQTYPAQGAQAAQGTQRHTHHPPRSQTVAPVRPNLPPASSVPPVPQIPPMHTQPHPTTTTLPAHLRNVSASTVLSRPPNPPRPVSRESRASTDIYNVSPPDSPTVASRQRAGSSHQASGIQPVISPATTSYASPVSPASGIVPNQHVVPMLPRAQTAPTNIGQGGPPSLDLHIPSPTLSNLMPNFTSAQGPSSPSIRMIRNTGTWPMQPQPQTVPAVAAGYPYSAPPTNLDVNEALSQSLPPAPRPDQVASLGHRGVHAPRRLSGGFQAPIPRVPVGSRSSQDFHPGGPSYPRPHSQQHQYPEHQQQYPRPLSQQQHYTQNPHPLSQSFTQPQQQPQSPYAQSVQPQHQRPQEAFRPAPEEDVPLIISTPKGVSGAFDAPERRISGRRAETPILAPVPRHPRSNAQSAILRPPNERLDTIYSMSSTNGGGSSVAGPSNLTVPGPGSASSSARVSSLNRKQSRAERSAAKNIADAKRSGWSGRTKSTKRKKKKNIPDDAASSAAWTDVTTASTRTNFFGIGGGNGNPRPDSAAGQRGKQDRKCVVM